MARGALPTQVPGSRVRAARGATPVATVAPEPAMPPKRKRNRPTAADLVARGLKRAQDAIVTGSLVPIPREVVGVRVHLPSGKKAVDYPTALAFTTDYANVLVVCAGDLRIAAYPMMQWTRAELIFAPAK